MNRSILIKLVVVLLVAILVHSVFWFFKTGQLEKHINNFVTENGSNVSVGEVKVSGYPFSQRVVIKDLKFSIPHPAFNKYQIIVKNLEATSGIFSSDFAVDVIDRVMVQDAESNAGNVEFNQIPQIAFSVMDGIVSHFAYSDNGYRVFDIDKNTIYAVGSSSLTIESSIDSNDQITSKLIANIRDVEGVDILDLYRNSSEKKIIDGIKTGEISIGGGATTAMISTDPAAANMVAAGVSPQEAAKIAAVNSGIATGSNTPAVANGAVASAPVANVANGAVAPAAGAAMASAAGTIATNANNVASAPAVAAPTAAMAPAAAEAAPTIDVAAMIAKNEVVKSNLLIDIEYVLTPTKNEQQATVPLDPTQIQEVATQYSRVVKVNNIEFSNPLYKIALNGQVNYFQDDNLPSGFLTIRVENLDKLTDHVKIGFTQIAEQKQILPDVQATDLSSAQAMQSQGGAYQDFLKKVALGITNISKELAAKNQLSKDNIAVFDMRREKNLEFVINETPLREVLGKF